MIIVSSLQDFKNAVDKYKAKYLISVIDPGFIPKTPNNISHHLKLSFDDIIEIKNENSIHRNYNDNQTFYQNEPISNQILPNIDHVQQIVDFVSKWDGFSPIVIHCWCGVSRSMATAIYIIFKMNPNNVESNIKYIRSKAPHANPNKLMISMFENLLNIPGEINNGFKNYPNTVKYDCENNFAPITKFSPKEI